MLVGALHPPAPYPRPVHGYEQPAKCPSAKAAHLRVEPEEDQALAVREGDAAGEQGRVRLQLLQGRGWG